LNELGQGLPSAVLGCQPSDRVSVPCQAPAWEHLTVEELPELTVEAGTTPQFGFGPCLGAEEIVIATLRECSNTVFCCAGVGAEGPAQPALLIVLIVVP
jgi:hypothetical protein